jgi:beta-lactamase superfamily II metal-dependent hydrolase
MNIKRNGDLEDEVLYAQVDSYLERKDYQRNGRCVRFTAIRARDLSTLGDEGGVRTLTVDLSFWRFCQMIAPARWATKNVQEEITSGFHSEGKEGPWYALNVRWNDKVRHGYLYANFTDDGPTFFSLTSCVSLPAGVLSALTSGSSIGGLSFLKLTTMTAINKDFGAGHPWSFRTFHVGQGMCSLLSDGNEHGILLDAGAGTPVTRPKYLSAAPVMPNDLRKRLDKLTNVDLVLSHADRDHWCLLSWDKDLRDKVQNIYLPHGAKSIAMRDGAVIDKVQPIKGINYFLKGGGTLTVLRSRPADVNSNTDCLVSVYRCEKDAHLVLQSGDYVYEDMKIDKNSLISTLDKDLYTAIVVPHHGDKASANDVFAARVPGHSIAFFSAGDNIRYGHPTNVSREAHEKARYREICDQTINHIQEIQLAP